MQLFVTFAENCLILPMDSQSSHVAFLSYVPRAHRAMVHSRPLCHFSANQPSCTAHFEQITRNSLACPSHRKSLQCLDRQKVEARIFGSYLWWRIVMIIMRLVVLIPFIPCVYPVVVLWASLADTFHATSTPCSPSAPPLQTVTSPCSFMSPMLLAARALNLRVSASLPCTKKTFISTAVQACLIILALE